MRDAKYSGILLVCDMDKTLLNSHSKVSSKNRNALIEFTENGGRFTIATGRMQEAVKPYIKDLPINAPAILYNGASIYDFDKKEVIWRKCLDNRIFQIIEDVYNRFDDIGIEVYSGDKVYIARDNAEAKKHMIREALSSIYCKLEEVPFPWIKLILVSEHSRLKVVEEYLKDKVSFFRTVFSEPQFLEVIESNVSKGAALRQLETIFKDSVTTVVSVGDNLNDVELIKNAHFGVAVDNAHPYLKEIADACCCHHDEDAIAQVIEWIKEDNLRK